MLRGSLYALPTFLAFLGTGPRPADVTAGLLDGPLRAFNATSCGIYVLRDGNLRLLHMRGVPEAMRERYAIVDASLDVPIARATRSRGPVIARPAELRLHVALRTDGAVWEEFAATGPGDDGLVVHRRFTVSGQGEGVLVFATPDSFEIDARSLGLIEALAAAVGMWLAAFPETSPMRLPQTHVLTLTDRQREILHLVERGETNARIAAKLGYSVSTVKQDLLRAMRLLGSHAREEAPARAREIGLLA